MKVKEGMEKPLKEEERTEGRRDDMSLMLWPSLATGPT